MVPHSDDASTMLRTEVSAGSGAGKELVGVPRCYGTILGGGHGAIGLCLGLSGRKNLTPGVDRNVLNVFA